MWQILFIKVKNVDGATKIIGFVPSPKRLNTQHGTCDM